MIDAAIKHGNFPSDENRIIKYLSSNLMCEYNWLPAEKREVANQVKSVLADLDMKNEDGKKFKKRLLPRLVLRKFSKSFLTLSYIVIKLIYLLNAIGQIFIMDMFLCQKKAYFTASRYLSRF